MGTFGTSVWGVHPTDITDPEDPPKEEQDTLVPNEVEFGGDDPNNEDKTPKRRRGRPKGAKNKPKPSKPKVKEESNAVPKGSQRKRWFFTMNNYTDADVEVLQRFFDLEVVIGGFQSEIAPRTGTKHIQGFFTLSRRMRFQQFGLKPSTHFEAMRGTVTECVKYVTKDESFDSEANIRFLKGVALPEPVETIKEENFFEWQKEAYSILQSEPDKRVIYWKFDGGNTGKSAFVKWACVNLGAIMVSGRGADVKQGIVHYMASNNGIAPKIIFVDIPRSALLSWNSSYADFVAIESVKNGNFFSTKYESQQILMNEPHVMIFANNYPNLDLLTRDRWDVREIKLTDDELALIEENTPQTVIENEPESIK